MKWGNQMLKSFSDNKKNIISWVMYVISIILFIIQVVISLSPATESESDLLAVGVLIIIIGLINILVIILGIVLFHKTVNIEKGKTIMLIGMILRVCVLIPESLLTLIWIYGLIKK